MFMVIKGMKLSKRTWIVLVILAAVALSLAVGFFRYTLYLQKAHSSFDNYYAFRGCEKLLSRTATDGTCVTHSGQTIRIVESQGRWYLDGDLPACLDAACKWQVWN